MIINRNQMYLIDFKERIISFLIVWRIIIVLIHIGEHRPQNVNFALKMNELFT